MHRLHSPNHMQKDEVVCFHAREIEELVMLVTMILLILSLFEKKQTNWYSIHTKDFIWKEYFSMRNIAKREENSYFLSLRA